MQLGDSVGVEIFSPDFTPLGPLERKTALRWLERFTSYGEFELWCPITEQNSSLLVKDNIVWIGGKSAGIIEYIQKERDKSSSFEFHVKGRLLECKLEGRVVYPTFSYSGKASGALQNMVGKYCVSPEDETRKIPHLFLAEMDENFGEQISYQQTGSDVLEEQKSLAEANNLGFTVEFDPFNKQYLYKVLEPTDRSWSQVENDPVVFDSASDEILDSIYTINWANGRNVAIVAGEGEGSNRTVIEIFDPSYRAGDAIKELWVDARDLQRDSEGGSESSLPSGYTQLEYIESSGAQYIDTGVAASDTVGIQLDVEIATFVSGNVFAGSRGSGDTRFWFGANGNESAPTMHYGWNTTNTAAISLAGRNQINFNYLNDRKVSVSGVTAGNITTVLGNNTRTIFVFCGNNNGTPAHYYPIKVYGMKITNGSNLIRSFVPAKNSSGTIGLYDTVNSKFYTNAGTGEFIAGPEVESNSYVSLLAQRGLQRLSEYRYIESFKSTIKTFGYQQNVYGVDFFLGDLVTVIDRELGVTVNTQVTEVEQTWDSKGYQVDITFGSPQPTILDIIRRM